MSKPQFTLFTHTVGPNGWKVAIILEELGLTYESKYLSFDKGENIAPEYTKFNPNGRIPTIIDHGNNDFVLWESNAIIEYLVAKYDPEHKISFADFDNQIIARQYSYFQASGQGPYYGQGVYFQKIWPEKLPAIIERYQNQTKRVLHVLDKILEGKDWLVANKLSYVDLCFYNWNTSVDRIILPGQDYINKETPNVARWMKAMGERASVKKIMETRAQVLPALPH